jgi:L-iditol 2-dehydrogenase
LVVGAGTIGLLLIQVLRTSGCSTVIAMDIEANKLRRAHDAGADFCPDPWSWESTKRVLERTAGRGTDIAFEAVGITGRGFQQGPSGHPYALRYPGTLTMTRPGPRRCS